MNVPRRWRLYLKGTRQNNSVTLGEGKPKKGHRKLETATVY